MRVLICGGGVIGASAAYYLSRRGVKAVVIERTGLACAASGKSGGFLALDWCDGTPLQNLARRSFALHASLAQQIDADWGYRRLTTYSGAVAYGRARHHLDWLAQDVNLDHRLGTTETTAQVHPARFTRAMMAAAEALGAELHAGEVQGVARTAKEDRVTGVIVNGETIEADAVVIAMGPWSMRAAHWLPLPPVVGFKGHSLLFETGEQTPAEALFLELREETGGVLSPEIVPRPDGTTWVCAISSDSPLPLDPATVNPAPGAMDRLETLCRKLSPLLANGKIIARQACFRPVTPDGLPVIGPIRGVPGAYVATGHSVWGILNAPATGEALAELIVDGSTGSVDVSGFDTARLQIAHADPSES
jgi:glycine/D-amino acid oxidase-like deaminating enzyme